MIVKIEMMHESNHSKNRICVIMFPFLEMIDESLFHGTIETGLFQSLSRYASVGMT